MSSRAICSIRFAERKFLLTIAQTKLLSHSRSELLLTSPLGILQRWQDLSVSQQWLHWEPFPADRAGAYTTCLYDLPLGEQNDPYTKTYFEILVGKISNRYMTYHWDWFRSFRWSSITPVVKCSRIVKDSRLSQAEFDFYDTLQGNLASCSPLPLVSGMSAAILVSIPLQCMAGTHMFFLYSTIT